MSTLSVNPKLSAAGLARDTAGASMTLTLSVDTRDTASAACSVIVTV